MVTSCLRPRWSNGLCALGGDGKPGGRLGAEGVAGRSAKGSATACRTGEGRPGGRPHTENGPFSAQNTPFSPIFKPNLEPFAALYHHVT